MSIEPAGDISVRRLAPADWKLLKGLRLRALQDSPDAFASTLEREVGFDEETWRSRCVTSAYFLAEVGGTPCGIVAGFRDFAAPDEQAGSPASPASLEMVSMWVAPEYRRLGVASELVEHLLEFGRSEDVDEVSLWVAEGNGAAVATYVRLGFEATGAVQPLPHRPERCETRMSLTLG
ncbi:MAG: GNAT family N-acetyltransferase [Acidimicrobiales bacterium]